jgi:hypothetical protein
MYKFYINYICPGKSNPKLDFQDLPEACKTPQLERKGGTDRIFFL